MYKFMKIMIEREEKEREIKECKKRNKYWNK